MNFKILIAACALAGVVTAGAMAHGGATGIVKERMDAMVSMSKIVKSLSEMMRGDRDYDENAVRDGAKIIRSHAGKTMTALFPEGSGGMPSEARAEIWADFDAFRELADRLALFADGLQSAAGNGVMMTGTGNLEAGNGMASMMGTDASGKMTGGKMMGGGMTGSGPGMVPDAAMLASMPADGVFTMVTQTCSACHTRFRLEKK